MLFSKKEGSILCLMAVERGGSLQKRREMLSGNNGHGDKLTAIVTRAVRLPEQYTRSQPTTNGLYASEVPVNVSLNGRTNETKVQERGVCNATVTGHGYNEHKEKSSTTGEEYNEDYWKIACSKGACGRKCAMDEARREVRSPKLYSGSCADSTQTNQQENKDKRFKVVEVRRF